MDIRYQIERTSTGEGGFGRIDKAQDTELERPVAIKTLDPLFKTKPTERTSKDSVVRPRLLRASRTRTSPLSMTSTSRLSRESSDSYSSGSRGRRCASTFRTAVFCRLRRRERTSR